MSPGSFQSPADAQTQPNHRVLRATRAGPSSPPAAPLSASGSGLSPGTTSASASTPAPPTPAVSRRSHAKSKSGCRTCKRRKIKCDETRPSCRNCIKHAVTCDFTIRNASSNLHTTSRAASPGSSRYIGDQAHLAGSLNMTDLELIHNFTSFTYATVSSDHGVRQMMRSTVMRLAFECDFLMRTILALSAVHLAHFRRERRDYYVSVGMEHHQVACRLAVELMNKMDSLTLQDCECLHLFSVLTMFFALGTPKSEHDSLVMGDSMIPSWLTMLRSAEPILRILDPESYKGALSPLFAFGRERWNIIWRRTQPPGSSILSELQSAINKSCTDPELLYIYNDVLDKLRRILSMLVLNSSPSDTSYDGDGDAAMQPPSQLPRLEAWDIFVWQWSAAKDFIPLLRGPEPRQEAVVIYAHFLIMLKKLENHWWLEGWAMHIMEKVWASLDEEHRLWIQWPIEEMGWVPP